MQQNADISDPKWHHPVELLKLQQLKVKKRALQARINKCVLNKAASKTISSDDKNRTFDEVLSARKRKNPFSLNDNNNKRSKSEVSAILEESSDQTLFKLLSQNTSTTSSTTTKFTSFSNILNRSKQDKEVVEVVKCQGEKWFPIDWSLKTKIRLWSKTPFPWNNKLKISEEASGITSFTRCLDTTADTSPNARFHQCTLYWQHPTLPWLSLFPRTFKKTNLESGPINIVTNSTIRSSLYNAWADSFRSLFQLIRTKQCPFFYLCAHTFTALFRAAGISGFDDVHVLITPSTRGFRNLLKQEEIEFTMPMKIKRNSDQGGYDDTLDYSFGGEQTAIALIEGEEFTIDDDKEEGEDGINNEQWLREMGITADDIKRINSTQEKINHKTECQLDNSEQSLLLIEGVEVNCLYNFLINCKTITSASGCLAGIPPTLLAPVAFNGATLNSLKVRESKVHLDNNDFYSMEIAGPILPTTVHNLFAINTTVEHSLSLSATFTSLHSTNNFSKIQRKEKGAAKNNLIFGKENLSECGLNEEILKRFCMSDPKFITILECLKYNSENKTFTWT